MVLGGERSFRARRISRFDPRVGAARDVGAGGPRSAGVSIMFVGRQVGQHGPGQRRRGPLPAGPACSTRDRARPHRARFARPRGLRRVAARNDSARSVPLPGTQGVGANNWHTSPNGGTRPAPALDAAIDELERSARRTPHAGPGSPMVSSTTRRSLNCARGSIGRESRQSHWQSGPTLTPSALERLVDGRIGRCAPRKRSRRTAARHARRGRAPQGARRAWRDRRDAASTAAVLTRNAERTGRRSRPTPSPGRNPPLSVSVQFRTRRSADRIPKVRPGAAWLP